jgi:hypothetical protein
MNSRIIVAELGMDSEDSTLNLQNSCTWFLDSYAPFMNGLLTDGFLRKLHSKMQDAKKEADSIFRLWEIITHQSKP